MTKQHFIGMAGLHGCLPNCCYSFESYGNAVESMAEIHDLGKNRKRTLKRDAYLELNLHRDGNEYIEITSCDCEDPSVHSDS